jgi:eukaryotic-like serine/threonine-protein kinase
MDGTVRQALEGVIISHYQIQQRLAHGGMSDIYLARDTQTEQIVAIKLVDRRNDVHYECIQHEVQALRALTHENVLPVLEYGEHGPWCYETILEQGQRKSFFSVMIFSSAQRACSR